MSEVKFKGIVIKSKDYKEKDKLVTIFTLEFGKITAVLRGVKNFMAKLKFAKEVFCFADFIVGKSNGFNIVTGADCIETFHDLTHNIDKFYEACSVIDILDIVTKENEPDAYLFIEVLKCLNAIKNPNVKEGYGLIKFLCNIFTATGYNLELERCSECREKFHEGESKYLNINSGEITCKLCRNDNNMIITPPVLKCLQLINQTDYERLHTLNLFEGTNILAIDLLANNFKARFNIPFKNFLKY